MEPAAIVFLIASHRNPEQVVRLAARILSDLPDAAVLVHHDQSKSLLDRSALPPGRIELVEDAISGTWGEASLVHITSRCLDRIAVRWPAYEWVVLISGQDYPLRHLGSLPATLAGMGDGYVDVEPPEFEEPLRYALRWTRLPARFQTARVSRLFDRLIYHLNGRQRFLRFANGRLGCWIGVAWPSPIPKGWQIHQGSNWWTLKRRAIETYRRLRTERPELYRWFVERTIVPDEGIFQTLLLNAPELQLGLTDIRYIRWDDRSSGSPATLKLEDLPALRASGRYFGRKFDADLDVRVLDALDAEAGRLA